MVRKALPGSSLSEEIAEMIRVDHAGEYGAVRIYQGQLAVLRSKARTQDDEETIKMIEHMEEQEHVHLETFNKLIRDRRVRPTAMTPIWHAAGFALGAVTAALGEKAAMACTEAVETVIDKHYEAQVERLGETEPELSRTLEKFREEELEHRDIAIDNGSQETPGHRFLSDVIKLGCRAAIRISEKV